MERRKGGGLDVGGGKEEEWMLSIWGVKRCVEKKSIRRVLNLLL